MVSVNFDLYKIYPTAEQFISYEVTSEMVPSEAASMKGVLNRT